VYREEFTQGEDVPSPAFRPLEDRNTGNSADGQERAFSREAVAGVMRQQGRYKEAERYESCGRVIVDYCPTCKYTAPKVRVFRCGLRECRDCSRIESNRLFNRIIKEVVKVPAVAGWRWRHVVLTSRRIKTNFLRDDYLKVKFGLDRVQNYFRRAKFKPKIGACGGIEFGPKNQMVHCHLFIFCPFLNKDELQKVWKLGTIFFKEVESERQTLEACLYAINFSKMKDPVLLATIGLVMKKTRRVFTWGRLYGSARKDKKPKIEHKCPCCGEKLHWHFDQEQSPSIPRAGPDEGADWS
jgi:hypothetical protein